MTVNYLAVLVAGVAGWLVGAVWYGVFAKQWMAASGKTAAQMMDTAGKRKMPTGPMIIAVIADIVMAYMLAGVIGDIATPSIGAGLVAGGLAWLGFVVTTMAVNNAFQDRKLALSVIDGGHWLAVLLLQGAIIGAFGPG